MIIIASIDLHQQETSVPRPVHIPVTLAMSVCRQAVCWECTWSQGYAGSGSRVCPLNSCGLNMNYLHSRNFRWFSFLLMIFKMRLCREGTQGKLGCLLPSNCKAHTSSVSELHPSSTSLWLLPWVWGDWLCHLSHCGGPWEWVPKMKTVWSLSSKSSQIIINSRK